MKTKSDLKFFTNSDNDSLLNRFYQTIKDTQFFDVLVGYFRTSGFKLISQNLDKVDKVRILVGLNYDRITYNLAEAAKVQAELDFESHFSTAENYIESLQNEMEESEDSKEIEYSAKQFIEFIKSGKLQLKVHPSQNIHAKVYISRFNEDDRDYGRVITGSSNFSENGFSAQREFNVELKDKADVEFALERFEELWAEGVEVSDLYIDTVTKKTWLNDNITPYEIFLKLLFEYFKEDINSVEELEFSLPDGFMDLAYQKQAVVSAIKILENYNGVFLSDVVGLGKTFITALLLQQLPPGRKLIICPPVLADYWRETLHQFYVPGFEVESLGKLDKIIKKGLDRYTYIVIDEAHRFRNELTQSYEALHKICRNKKVILVSATPLNNKLDDIKSQIKLFQSSKNSSIPGVPNLENFFRAQQKSLDEYDKGTPEYLDAVKTTSEAVRDKVLKHLMVRRTRSEIKAFFGEDILKQGLHFPELGEPQRIVYEFDEKSGAAFDKTIDLLSTFAYARYTPFLFLKTQLSEFELQSQRNVGGFMKGLLVKRLESSLFAFRKSLERFIISYKKFIEMYDAGTVWISSEVDVYELLDSDNQEKLLSLLDEDKAKQYQSKDFSPSFKASLLNDLEILQTIENIWKGISYDPKIETFIKSLKTDPVLKNNKVIVFSESKETIDHLQIELTKEFGNKVLSYSSEGGFFNGSFHKGDLLREVIKANYQPKYNDASDEVQILLTTDVLAEGINLHRSNIIINYDLPWNPTRVLQRVGRVNRVGTDHKSVYVFNIFPTTKSDEHLGLENNIKAKIQAFHNTLGEDAKYLSDEEELSTHELFGEKLYKKLTDRSTFEDEGDLDSELKYLNLIRQIRDNEPELYSKIKSLPKKARTARVSSDAQDKLHSGLLTFFRRGRLKRFVFSDDTISSELTFMEAASLFECKKDETRKNIPEEYYELLSKNKNFLDEIMGEGPHDLSVSRPRGSSNEATILKTIKAISKFNGFTDEDDDFLKRVIQAIENGDIPKNTSKRVKQEISKNLSPLAVLQVLRKNIKLSELVEHNKTSKITSVKEVVLNEFIIGGNK